MTMIKSLILGSAAGMIAMSGAQAADLPVKAKAVEYVKVCSLYGAGFYYIPGTDTCLKIGGFIRVDSSFNASGVYGTPYFGGVGLSNTRAKDYFIGRVRASLQMDSRTATEYGVLRTFLDTKFQWSDGLAADTIAGGNNEVDLAFIQFAGFTIGKAVSQFDTQWVLAHPSISSGFTGGSDNKTGIPQLAYTASFGNGFSATIAAETPRPYRKGFIYDVNDTLGVPGVTTFVDSTSGQMMPDFVGNLRLDQAWGSLHLGAAVHQVAMQYNGIPGSNSATTQLTGNFEDKYGFAVTGGFELKNLPTGVGDTLRGDFTYANGATRYVFGGTSNIPGSGFAIYNGNSVSFGQYFDAVFSSPGGAIVSRDLQLSTDFAARLFYEHYWNPAWRTSLWGVYARHENTDTGNAIMMAKYNNTYGGGLTGNANFTVYQVGSRTAWTPVKNLTFSAEVSYVWLDNNISGVITPATNPYPNRNLQAVGVSDQGSVVGQVQAVRSF